MVNRQEKRQEYVRGVVCRRKEIRDLWENILERTDFAERQG